VLALVPNIKKNERTPTANRQTNNNAASVLVSKLLDGYFDLGPGGKAQKSNASDSRGDGTDDPTIHSRGFGHEVRVLTLDTSGIDIHLVEVLRGLLVTCRRVDEFVPEGEGDDGRKRVLYNNSASGGSFLAVACLVLDVVLDDVLAVLLAFDLVMAGGEGMGCRRPGVFGQVLIVGGTKIVVLGGLGALGDVLRECLASRIPGDPAAELEHLKTNFGQSPWSEP